MTLLRFELAVIIFKRYRLHDAQHKIFLHLAVTDHRIVLVRQEIFSKSSNKEMQFTIRHKHFTFSVSMSSMYCCRKSVYSWLQ